MKSVSMLFSLLLLTDHSVYGVDFSDMNLNAYLSEKKVAIDEGFVTPLQKKEFIHDIQRESPIRKILEIGFNVGHSAEFFLSNTDCEKLVSFDINIHPYLETGLEFISKKYGDRFTFVEGDSRIQVPLYAALNTDEKFDLIFIDGGHSYDCCFADILNCKKLATPDTVVLIDDYVAEVKAAVDSCVQCGWLSIVDIKHLTDPKLGDRIWVVARYSKLKIK